MDALLNRLDPTDLTRWGYRAIVGLVAGGSLLVLLLIWWKPPWLLGLPIALTGALIVSALARRPLVHLALVLAGFVAISGHQPGLQVQEIVYGLYYLSFLAVWFAYRLIDQPGELIRRPEDKAIAFFLIYASAGVGLTYVFGGKLNSFIGEWLSISMLAFYWPARYYTERDERAAKWILGVLVWFALFGTIRNLLFFQDALQSAEQMWQILRGRVKLNEIFFISGCMIGVVGSLYVRSGKVRLGAISLFIVSFASLILTRSRGYWAAFALAMFVIFFFVDAKKKAITLGAAAFGFTGFILVGLLFFPTYFELVTASLIQRLSTFATAFTNDVSLINRMYETKAVLWKWAKNPILGYGMGTPYQYFYMLPTGKFTMHWPFVHNGYAGLLYKFGLIGTSAMAVFYLRGVWNGIQLFRSSDTVRFAQAVGLICAAFLIGEMLVANTSNPFIISDGNLLIALTVALATGLRARTTRADANAKQ